ncbi:hypothetical protein [Ensifer soli]|uniref:hypothetical protein n=1 Tax=Ciceribacter sp. sgz301302 TaxID=3342379 RepID=UPI0035B6F0C7
MQKFIDPDHPFYRPLWVRLLIAASCLFWTAIELYNGEMVWGMLFLAVTTYVVCVLLIFFNPKAPEPPKPDEPAT